MSSDAARNMRHLTPSFRRLSPLLWATLAAVLASGCAQRSASVRLRYPPPDEPRVVPVTARWSVALVPVRDGRELPRDVLYRLPTLVGKPSFSVVTPDDVAAWATDALRLELERQGCRVVEPGPGVPVVRAELVAIEVGVGDRFVGAVALAGAIEIDGARRAEAAYGGRGSGRYHISQQGNVPAVTRALQGAARELAINARIVATGLQLPPPNPFRPAEIP